MWLFIEEYSSWIYFITKPKQDFLKVNLQCVVNDTFCDVYFPPSYFF